MKLYLLVFALWLADPPQGWSRSGIAKRHEWVDAFCRLPNSEKLEVCHHLPIIELFFLVVPAVEVEAVIGVDRSSKADGAGEGSIALMDWPKVTNAKDTEVKMEVLRGSLI